MYLGDHAAQKCSQVCRQETLAGETHKHQQNTFVPTSTMLLHVACMANIVVHDNCFVMVKFCDNEGGHRSSASR